MAYKVVIYGRGQKERRNVYWEENYNTKNQAKNFIKYLDRTGTYLNKKDYKILKVK